LYIPASAARRLDEGEFWDHDLVGCVVVTTDGRELGPVSEVLHQPAGELLAVGDLLVPFIKDVVREVVPRERITIEPLPGLLD
jgi:16S rRNA processing protein RimM